MSSLIDIIHKDMLKPCPLCHSTDVTLDSENCDDYWLAAYVKCNNCGIQSPDFWGDGGERDAGFQPPRKVKDQAVKWWRDLGRRYGSQEPDHEIDTVIAENITELRKHGFDSDLLEPARDN